MIKKNPKTFQKFVLTIGTQTTAARRIVGTLQQTTRTVFVDRWDTTHALSVVAGAPRVGEKSVHAQTSIPQPVQVGGVMPTTGQKTNGGQHNRHYENIKKRVSIYQ